MENEKIQSDVVCKHSEKDANELKRTIGFLKREIKMREGNRSYVKHYKIAISAIEKQIEVEKNSNTLWVRRKR